MESWFPGATVGGSLQIQGWPELDPISGESSSKQEPARWLGLLPSLKTLVPPVCWEVRTDSSNFSSDLCDPPKKTRIIKIRNKATIHIKTTSRYIHTRMLFRPIHQLYPGVFSPDRNSRCWTWSWLFSVHMFWGGHHVSSQVLPLLKDAKGVACLPSWQLMR